VVKGAQAEKLVTADLADEAALGEVVIHGQRHTIIPIITIMVTTTITITL
jgi:hypothetical protein